MLKGIIPPVITPMSGTGQIDHASLRKHVQQLLDIGAHGLWLNGSTGEFFALNPTQRAEAIASCAQEAGDRVPVIAQVGATATTETIGLAKSALDAGATHLAVIAPYYAQYTQPELLLHYRRIAEAVQQPVVIYHLPSLTKIGLTIESVLTLVREGAANAIKDSSSDLVRYRELLSKAEEEALELRCFTGGASVTDLGLFVGGAGAMPAIANLIPSHTVRMYDAATAKDWTGLTGMQRSVDQLIAAMRLPGRTETWTPTIAIYKSIMAMRGQIPDDSVAMPLTPLDRSEKQRLREKAIPIIEDLEA